MKHVFILFLSTMLMLCEVSAVSAQSLTTAIKTSIEQDYADFQRIYEHLHAHPELSLQEQKTAEYLAKTWRQLGLKVTSGVGGHGVVGVLENGPGKTVLLRADMDALPIKEETGLPYSSQMVVQNDHQEQVPVMHACGHDMHMTVLTAAARTLVKAKASWQGTVVFIAQPAEEKGMGAKAMLEDGLYTRFPKPDYAFALHVNPELPAGQLGYRMGPMFANVDFVDVTVWGKGGHGAIPQETIDPVVLAAQIVLGLQTVVSRHISPIEPAVLTVGSIHGGTKHNIIPDKVKLELTLRSYSDDVREQMIDAIRRITRGMAEAAGMPKDRLPEIKVLDGHTPATVNDLALTQRLVKAFKNILGAEQVVEMKPTMGGEDFSRYGREAIPLPITMFWLGSVDPEKAALAKQGKLSLPTIHSSHYAPLPKPTILTGAYVMSTAVLDLLAK